MHPSAMHSQPSPPHRSFLRLPNIALLLSALFSLLLNTHAQFSENTLLLSVIGDGTTSLSSDAHPLSVIELLPNGTPTGKSITLPSTSDHAMTDSGSAASSGHLQPSLDGSRLFITAFRTPLGTSKVTSSTSAKIPRIVASIQRDLSIQNILQLNSSFSGEAIRSVTESPANILYLAGNSGIFRALTTSTDTPTEKITNQDGIRLVASFSDASKQQFIAASQSTDVLRFAPTPNVLPPSPLGLRLQDAHAFVLLDRSPTVGATGLGGLDTLYVADGSSDDASGQAVLRKFEWRDASWQPAGVATLPLDGSKLFGLTAQRETNGAVTLFATTSISSDNAVVTIADRSNNNRFGGDLSGTLTIIAKAGPNRAFRGVTTLPQNTLPDLTTALKAPSNARVGTPFPLTVTVTNRGRKASTPTQLAFKLPASLTWKLPTGAPTRTFTNSEGLTLTDIPAILPNEKLELTLDATPTQEGTISLIANAFQSDSTQSVLESHETNNGSNAQTVLVQQPKTSLSALQPRIFQRGDSNAPISIRLRNIGSAATDGRVDIVPSLPSGLRLLSASGTGWTPVKDARGAILRLSSSNTVAPKSEFPELTLILAVDALASDYAKVSLTSSGGGDQSTTDESSTTLQIRIQNAAIGAAAFESPNIVIPKTPGKVAVKLIRTGGRQGTLTTSVSAKDGSAFSQKDFRLLSTSVSFANGVESASIMVEILPNPSATTHRTFTLQLSQPSQSTQTKTTSVTILEPDNIPPTIKITAPASAAIIEGNVVNLTGQILDNQAGSKLHYSLNGSTFKSAPLATSGTFNVPLTPKPGLNSIRLTAKDLAGNESSADRSFLRSAPSPLNLLIEPKNGGAVSLTPNVDLTKVQIDSALTLTATPALGFVWSGWEISSRPGELIRSQKLNAQMSAGLAIRAKFTPSPFAASAGNFTGIVRPQKPIQPRHESSGSIRLSLTSEGVISGKIILGNEELSIAASLDETGTARFGEPAADFLPWYRNDGRTLLLRVTRSPFSPFEIAGTLSESTSKAETPVTSFTLTKSPTLAKNPNPGTYNVAASAQKQANGIGRTDFHEGPILGTVTVPPQGNVAFSLRLPDGTTVTGSNPLSENGGIIAHATLHSGAGQLSGVIKLDTSSKASGISSEDMLWFMPPGITNAFPIGWPEGLQLSLLGALLPSIAPTRDQLVPNLASTAPNCRLTFISRGLALPIQSEAFLAPDGTLTSLPSQPSITAKLDLKTGSLDGTVDAKEATPTAFRMLLIPKKQGSTALGTFLLSKGQSGSVILSPLGGTQGKLLVSEISSNGSTSFTDEDGQPSDWIELHNPNNLPVDLKGWALTDERDNPAKWSFPDVRIAPRSFLLVWASGKDRRKPGSHLHTNFSLNAKGEYLALMRPDGTPEQSFIDGVPALSTGESYGINFGTKKLISPGTPCRYFDSGQALPSNWTQPEFDDSSWKSGAQPLGYGICVKGLTVRQVIASPSLGGVSNLAQADALVTLPKGHPNISAEKTFLAPQLNLLGEGSDGHYDANIAIPQPGEPYAIRAIGTLLIQEDGIYTFGLNSDDGGTIRIDGKPVMIDDTNHGPEDHFSGPISLTSGPHSIEVVMWEAGGGDEVELFAARGAHSSWNQDFKLIGASDGIPVVTFDAPSTESSIIATDLSNSVRGKRTDFAARFNFTCADPSQVDQLTLNIAFNDGFIISLNGTEIIRENAGIAPDSPTSAMKAKEPSTSLSPSFYDVSKGKSLLKKGANVLAVRTLSSSLTDSSTLLSVSLVASGSANFQYGFFTPDTLGLTSTPGKINGASFAPSRLGPVRFSHSRGTYTATFPLTLTPPESDSTIRYTVDGSVPTAEHGEIYSTPVTISKTTILRVAAFRSGSKPGPVSTTTFLFPTDIIRQSADGKPPGPNWPASNVNSQVLDYGMDQRIVNSINPEEGGKDAVIAALNAIPSLSLVTDLENLFNPSSGIWVNPYNRGLAWERSASIELLNDPLHPARGFQSDCGIRIRGGFSRSTDNPKHALKFYFRDTYGGPLRYPLFGDQGASYFEQIDLRTAQNYSWSFGGDGNNTFIREEITREVQGAMGHPHARGRDFHLFINGQYWGLYNLDERTEASFAATYLGGKKADYDAIKTEQDAGYSTGVNDGNLDAWTQLFEQSKSLRDTPSNAAYFALQGLKPDGVTPGDTPTLLDVDNLIDYMLLTFWTGNLDGCTSAFLGDNNANNWSSVRDRTGKRGFVFFAHDFEHSFFDLYQDRTGPFETANRDQLAYSNPMFIHHNLRTNAEYRMRWADRIQMHCFGKGALTANSLIARIQARAQIIDRVIRAESARWGDAKSSTPLTRIHWQAARDYLLNNYVPNRGPIVLQQLRDDGLYPSLNAPECSPAGGNVTPGSYASFTSAGGTIRYTWDGPDPRSVGGKADPSAKSILTSPSTSNLLTSATKWRILPVAKDLGAQWTLGTFDDSTWIMGTGEMGFGDGDETTIVPTVPDPAPGFARNVTTYFRTTFNITDPSSVVKLTARIKYDDGVALYLNGKEFYRSDNLPANATFLTLATSAAPDESATFTVEIPPILLIKGNNTLSAEIHQVAVDSSDISFRCDLDAGYTSRLLIPEGKHTLRFRSQSGNIWSALTTVAFDTTTIPSLRVDVSAPSLEAGSASVAQLSITNTGKTPLNSPVRIDCDLPTGLTVTSIAGVGWQPLSSSPSTFSAILMQPLAENASSTPLSLRCTVSPLASGTCAFTPRMSIASTSFQPATLPAPLPINRNGQPTINLPASTLIVPASAQAAVVTVVRTGNTSLPASVSLSTKDGTAQQPLDYTATNRTLTFEPGAYQKTVSIPLTANTNGEVAESFTVSITNPTGGVLGAVSSTTVLLTGRDTTPPTIRSTVKSGTVFTLPSATLTGSASDDQGVAAVEISINGDTWKPFGTISSIGAKSVTFSGNAELPAGYSLIALRSVDIAGNQSKEALLDVTRIPTNPLSVSARPSNGGTISVRPNGLQNWIPIGTSVELSATPKTGWFFSHWLLNSDQTPKRTNPLTITPTEQLAVSAIFVPSPYPASRAGNYVGCLVTADGDLPSRRSEGFLKLALTTSGTFSGTLTIAGETFPVTGALDLGGQLLASDASREITIVRVGSLPLKLTLVADLSGTQNLISATLNTADRTLTRPLAKGTLRKAAPSAAAQSIKLDLSPLSTTGTPTTARTPVTCNASISKSGTITLGATLADGAPISASTLLAEDGSTPFLIPYGPSKQHLLTGAPKLPTPSTTERILWIRSPDATHIRPEGWPNGLRMKLTPSK
jgi:hypothetical protein